MLSLQRNQTLPQGDFPLTTQLRDFVLNLQCLVREDGQDLVEYALLVALIAFAATSGMSHLATSINSAFSSIAGKLTIA